MPMEGRGLHSKGLTEDTLSVLRDGGNNGNEISKNALYWYIAVDGP